ncbi:MAG: hypothetical protein P1T08_15475 [Acidimicrobiia bacterium]|nr:hypothetical protein [Acidimicrobiia bacterium]
MEAEVVEVGISIEVEHDGTPVINHLNSSDYCRLSWARGGGPPFTRGIYLWTSDDHKVLYVGKATSNQTSHLYRRITAYKRATPGKTQWTSLRINSDILGYVQGGGRVRLICLSMPDADPEDVTHETLIDQARPPWNRRRNPHPRSVYAAMSLADLLDIPVSEPLPTSVSLPV